MKIDTLTIDNFKAIEHLQINFGGNNAVIYGQNGAGKTSILDAVTWLLTNRMSDGKAGESSNFHAPDKITKVALTFTNGLKLRRECNGKSIYFLNGVPCNATNFNYQINGIFNAALSTLLTPFNFCNYHYTERRAVLMKLFSPKVEIDLTGFKEIADELQNLTPQQIISKCKQQLKSLDKKLAEIPARISELSKLTADSDVGEIQSALSENKKQYEEIIAASSVKTQQYNKVVALENDARKLADKLSELRTEYRLNELELEKLRRTYNDTQKATSGTCPTCGNKIPAANLAKIKAALTEIVAQGKSLAENQAQLKQSAAELKKQLSEVQNLATQERQRYNELDAHSPTAKQLSENRAQYELLTRNLQTARQAAENCRRIEELKAQELNFAHEKAQCDKKIYQAEMYIRRQIELLEKSINSHFHFVTFKMFEDFKTVEGVKECCLPMLNGVPYFALSKGEKLKAALDILSSLQKAYKIQLPVFIDDAESYTSNSFVDLPNQVILLKAVEGVTELQIDIDAGKLERKIA